MLRFKTMNCHPRRKIIYLLATTGKYTVYKHTDEHNLRLKLKKKHPKLRLDLLYAYNKKEQTKQYNKRMKGPEWWQKFILVKL